MVPVLVYQVNYCLTSVPEQVAHFHAQFRRQNPLPYAEPYVILDGVKGLLCRHFDGVEH